MQSQSSALKFSLQNTSELEVSDPVDFHLLWMRSWLEKYHVEMPVELCFSEQLAGLIEIDQ